jgi:hypothetical protein
LVQEGEDFDVLCLVQEGEDFDVLCLVQEGEDFENEEASPNKRKKDPHKVDKKYLWPHGLGPPLKNCRKRRFRKTRKKKYVEAPEIEKEVRKIIPWQCNFSPLGIRSFANPGMFIPDPNFSIPDPRIKKNPDPQN